MVALIDNAGFIYGSYAITFAAVGLVTWRFLRQARHLADQVDDADKYWASTTAPPKGSQ